MSNVNLNLYKIFCKVAESKSYNEASDKLDGLSVANISTQISNLEKQLNLILFNRESASFIYKLCNYLYNNKT